VFTALVALSLWTLLVAKISSGSNQQRPDSASWQFWVPVSQPSSQISGTQLRGSGRSSSEVSLENKASIDEEIYVAKESVTKKETQYEPLAQSEFVRSLLEEEDSLPPRKLIERKKMVLDEEAVRVFEALRFSMEKLKPLVNWDTFEGRNRQKKRKQAVVIGSASIIKRDSLPISRAYETLGVNAVYAKDIHPAIARGRTEASLRSVRGQEWDIILCLSLKTKECVSLNEFSKLQYERSQSTRINRIAGLQTVLWSKEKFCTTSHFAGEWLPAFTFPCWVLPEQSESLLAHLVEHSSSGTDHVGGAWIVKPYKLGGGKGIYLLDTREEMELLLRSADRKVVVQPYLTNPHLFDGRKWDLRTYVLVTRIVPFARGYLYRDGLVRIATEQYDPRAAHGGNKTQFLTNTSINKRKQKDYSMLTWSFGRLEAELGFEKYQMLFSRIKRAVGMLLVVSEGQFAKFYRTSVNPSFKCSNCFHLLGVDLIVDDNLFPRVVEVNGEPSMQLSGETRSHYDTTKLQMQEEVARIVMKSKSNIIKSMLAFLRNLSLKPSMLRRLVRDEEALEYLMQLNREVSASENFQVVYPDADCCENPGRVKIWNEFLAAVEHVDERRSFLHEISTKLLCIA